jgi:hypothetical protein
MKSSFESSSFELPRGRTGLGGFGFGAFFDLVFVLGLVLGLVSVGWRASLRLRSARPTAALPADRCAASTKAGVASDASSSALGAGACGCAGAALPEAGSVSVALWRWESTVDRPYRPRIGISWACWGMGTDRPENTRRQFGLTNVCCQSRLTGMNAEDIARASASNDPSLGLRAALALHRLAERVEADHVATARQQGWSWQQIGDALGVTRQSVHAKYGKRLP